MFEELFSKKKLFIVCGSGGVGKTTVSATLALMAAMAGKKAIVITIDPARRLAVSLGFKEIGSKPQRIDPALIKKLDAKIATDNPEFYAMMLDSKNTFDQLVSKYAPSKEVEQKIINNKIYQHLSSMMAGSQEYMAMEKLYEVSSENEYEIIVIDTPPTVHAIDFLNAPQRMVDMLDHSMFSLFLKPALFVGKSGVSIFKKGSSLALKIFDKITGFAFLQQVSEMIISFQGLLGGFKSRAGDVKKILTDSQTAFLLVTACEEKSIREAAYFSKKLSELKFPLEAIILNRVHPCYDIAKGQRDADHEVLNEKLGDGLALKMMQSYMSYRDVSLRDREYSQYLKKDLGKKQLVSEIPLFESDIHSLDGLARLTEYLV